MAAPVHPGIAAERAASPIAGDQGLDPEQAVDLPPRDLRSSPEGLGSAEANRRTLQCGPNELRRHEGVSGQKEVWSQLTQLAALLLWLAAAVQFAISSSTSRSCWSSYQRDHGAGRGAAGRALRRGPLRGGEQFPPPPRPGALSRTPGPRIRIPDQRGEPGQARGSRAGRSRQPPSG